MLNPRFYTLAEARKTLPLVKRIVADIVATAGEIRSREAAFRRWKARGGRAGDDRAVAEELERLQARLQRYARELDQLGIELKDPAIGLIDYYMKRGDETVYLCWKHGEDGIEYWHDLESGFAGRQPLDAVDQRLDAAR